MLQQLDAQGAREGLLQDVESVHAVICYRVMAGVPAYIYSTDNNSIIALAEGVLRRRGAGKGRGICHMENRTRCCRVVTGIPALHRRQLCVG